MRPKITGHKLRQIPRVYVQHKKSDRDVVEKPGLTCNDSSQKTSGEWNSQSWKSTEIVNPGVNPRYYFRFCVPQCRLSDGPICDPLLFVRSPWRRPCPILCADAIRMEPPIPFAQNASLRLQPRPGRPIWIRPRGTTNAIHREWTISGNLSGPSIDRMKRENRWNGRPASRHWLRSSRFHESCIPDEEPRHLPMHPALIPHKGWCPCPATKTSILNNSSRTNSATAKAMSKSPRLSFSACGFGLRFIVHSESRQILRPNPAARKHQGPSLRIARPRASSYKLPATSEWAAFVGFDPHNPYHAM